VAHTPGNFSSFGSSASIYNFEKWTSEEKNQATISYHVAASMTGTEDDKMRYMMGNWIQQVRNNADGFENGRMPTTMEMKRFCVNLTTQAATSQQNQTQSTTPNIFGFDRLMRDVANQCGRLSLSVSDLQELIVQVHSGTVYNSTRVHV